MRTLFPLTFMRRPPPDEAGRLAPKVAPPVALPAGALELLVVQASPFCNLDCDYCYLPDRSNSARMPLERLDRVLAQVMASSLVGATVSVVWHAGEPMVVPPHWYEQAFRLVARHMGATRVTHHFQTNAVLVDPAWCDLFDRHQVRVGVSIDGPAALHDLHRKTRNGKGTHAQVMAGIARLQDAGIAYHTIAVLTRQALEQPDAIYDFFASLGTIEAGFNVEEIEGIHARSSLQAEEAKRTMRAFWERMVERVAAEPGRLRVREVDLILAMLRDPRFGRLSGNSQNQAGRILSVAQDGSFCFWSPELLGTVHPLRGSVVLGTLGGPTMDWAGARFQQALRNWQGEIDAGIARCRDNCAYFRLCLGGAPSNKLAEHGSMAVSETLACRLGHQVVIDAVLQSLQRELSTARTVAGGIDMM